MITAKPLFVLILVSGLEPSEPVGEPFMQNLLTEYEVLSEACDSLAQAELRTTEQAVGVLETKEADDMEEIISSAKFNLCAVKDKTGFVREKLVRLMNDAIFNKCLVDKQCSAMMPALDGIEEHFDSRTVMFEQALLSAKDLEKLLPANLVWMKSYSATLQLISDVYDMFSQFITPTVLGVWLVGIQMPVLIMFLLTFLAFMNWKKVLALSFLCILVLCFMHLPRAIQYQKLHQDTMENVANIKKLKITTGINDVKEFQTIAAYRDLKRMKDVAIKAIDVFKATVPNYSNHVRMLQKVGYSELADRSQGAYEQFQKYVTSLVVIMVKSRDFFDYVKRTFEVLLEMKGVKLMELKRFVKGILDDSIEIEAMYEDHKITFLGLIGKLNSLKQDAKKIEQENIKAMASIKNLAKWLTMGGVVLATGGVGLTFGAVGLAGAGAGIGIGAGAVGVGLAGAKYYENEVDTIEKKNVVLHDVQDIALVYKEYTKKINDVLHVMDASKLRSALTAIDKAASYQNIDHEDLEYYFGEVPVMAKENLDEVEKVMRGLKAISS